MSCCISIGIAVYSAADDIVYSGRTPNADDAKQRRLQRHSDTRTLVVGGETNMMMTSASCPVRSLTTMESRRHSHIRQCGRSLSSFLRAQSDGAGFAVSR